MWYFIVMENDTWSEFNTNKNAVDIARLNSGEARAWIEEMKETGNIEALNAELGRIKACYEGMRGYIGGEDEFQNYIYLIIEIKKALGLELNLD
jgi:hypothetical protein